MSLFTFVHCPTNTFPKRRRIDGALPHQNPPPAPCKNSSPLEYNPFRYYTGNEAEELEFGVRPHPPPGSVEESMFWHLIFPVRKLYIAIPIVPFQHYTGPTNTCEIRYCVTRQHQYWAVPAGLFEFYHGPIDGIGCCLVTQYRISHVFVGPV